MSASLFAAGVVGPISFLNGDKTNILTFVSFGLLAVSTAATAWSVFRGGSWLLIACIISTYAAWSIQWYTDQNKPEVEHRVPPLGLLTSYVLLCLARKK